MTNEEFRRIAELANIYVADDELERSKKDLEKMLPFLEMIDKNSAEIAVIEDIDTLECIYREDEVEPSTPQEEVLKNAPEAADGYFYIRRRAGK